MEELFNRVLALPVDLNAREELEVFRTVALFDREARELVEGLEEFLGLLPEHFRRERRTEDVGQKDLGARRHVAPEGLERLFGVAHEKDAGRFRQVVGEDGGRFKEERQIVFNAGRENAFFDVGVDQALSRVARKLRAPALAEGKERIRIHREFMPGEEPDFLCFLHRALGLYVEPSDRFDFVVEEVESEGAFGPHRKDVDDAPANGKFAGRKNLLHGGVAREREALLDRADRDPLALVKEEGARTNVGDRSHSLRRRDR